MAYKILLADDSLTIQKVIKITLADGPFKVSVAASTKELFKSLSDGEFDLLLLDFGISDAEDGIDVAKKVHDEHEDLKIIMMYGTFDNIDETEFGHAGIVDKVIKPFEGEKFISLCKKVVMGIDDTPEQLSSDDEDDFPDVIDNEEDEDIEFDSDNTGEWVVNSPELPNETPTPDSTDMLTELVSDWSMEVPPIIGDEQEMLEVSSSEIPPIIDESESLPNVETAISDSIPEVIDESESNEIQLDSVEESSDELEKFPDDDDLAYPTPIGQEEVTQEFKFDPSDIEAETPTSKLIPLSDLNIEDEGEVQSYDDATETDIDVTFMDKERNEKLDREIEDEKNESFWAVDEATNSSTQAEEPNLEIPTTSVPDEIHFNAEQLKHQPPIHVDIDIDQIQNEIHAKLSDELGPKIKDQFTKDIEKIVEKVAWEVIPDLAENIIKRELQKISEAVMDQKQ